MYVAAFCPAPKSHIRQPIAFDEGEEEDCDDDIPDAEWIWAAGVTNQTVLKYVSVKNSTLFFYLSLSHPTIPIHTCICIYIQGYACVCMYMLCVRLPYMSS